MGEESDPDLSASGSQSFTALQCTFQFLCTQSGEAMQRMNLSPHTRVCVCVFLPEIYVHSHSHTSFTIKVKLISCLSSNFSTAVLTLHWTQLKFLMILKI